MVLTAPLKIKAVYQVLKRKIVSEVSVNFLLARNNEELLWQRGNY